MAELLIRVRDSYKLTGDDEFDSKVSRRGDVIAVVPDGWAWGDRELDNPDWRILKMPGVSVSEASALTTSEVAKSPEPDPLLQFRGLKFDCDSPDLPKDLSDYLADDERTEGAFEAQMAPSAFAAVQTVKEAWPEERVKIASAEVGTAVEPR